MTGMMQRRVQLRTIVLVLGAVLAIPLLAGQAGADDAPPDEFKIGKIQFAQNVNAEEPDDSSSPAKDDPAGVTAEDPVVEYCQGRSSRGAYHDCQCVGEMAGEARTKLAEEMKASAIDSFSSHINKLQSLKEDAAGNLARLKGIEKQIADYEERLAKARSTPLELASKSIENATVWNYVINIPACRSRAGTYERSFDGCMNTTSNAPESAASAYCECVANNSADAWVDPENAALSVRNLGVPARRACKELAP